MEASWDTCNQKDPELDSRVTPTSQRPWVDWIEARGSGPGVMRAHPILSPRVLGYESGRTWPLCKRLDNFSHCSGWSTARKKASKLKIRKPELSTLGPLAQLDHSVP